MIKTFTPNDVLRYMYEDLEPDEKQAIGKAMILSSDLMDFYFQSLSVMDHLSLISKEPSDQSIERIMDYSRSFICNSV